jgi:hypothetical protein
VSASANGAMIVGRRVDKVIPVPTLPTSSKNAYYTLLLPLSISMKRLKVIAITAKAKACSG